MLKNHTPTLAGLDIAYDGGWSLWIPSGLNLSNSDPFLNF